MLEGSGFACEVAHDAATARNLLGAARFDTMTLDEKWRFPHTRAERAGILSPLPIVVVSAKASEDRLALQVAGFAVSDWINKSIEPERLLAALRSVMPAHNELPRTLLVEDDEKIRHGSSC